ncbi:hypothetical protein Htur_0972 [Haloterrigena turkmenica DSM 5511]|uniref:DUF8119 domain-containing protein n=1 Tax=Haloterrigena turkmenica (strain ATCC 51198 / DSM 5511 / JCM 9101 / NCIMB 13204 / VKM B-1734 / 4k) TaxID=543526 RepID=D2RYG5_HALTV|nr:hypothetical protein [Haloterrigena turkmenica]ADB59866.1 hypothetical protein Htur_0972 [Haloterrigena turkmenica DSM 5511]
MTGLSERLETIREERWGLLADLAFAVIWVTVVDVLFRVLQGPDWAYYMFMLGGIVAYFGFFASLKLARQQ